MLKKFVLVDFLYPKCSFFLEVSVFFGCWVATGLGMAQSHRIFPQQLGFNFKSGRSKQLDDAKMDEDDEDDEDDDDVTQLCRHDMNL